MRRVALVIAMSAASAGAEPRDREPTTTEVTADELVLGVRAARHARSGFVAITHGGYDGGGTLDAALETTLFERLTLRAMTANDGTQLHAGWGAYVDVARAERHGLDVAVGAEYLALGWNRVPAAIARVAAGRSVGGVRLLANGALGVGVGDEGTGERYGELHLAGTRQIARRWFAGVAARGRVDLERDADEPPGEPDWESSAGPVATYVQGRVALSAQAGLAASQLRGSTERRVGALGAVGVALAF